MKLEFPAGSDVALVRITGKRKNCEKAHVRILFPGGHVEVTRALDGDGSDYWVHLHVNQVQDGHNDYSEEDTARITDARLDVHGKHVSETSAVDFDSPNLYHIGLRVTRQADDERVAELRRKLLKDSLNS